MKTTVLNLAAITAILPILAKLEGYAMQHEPIMSVEWQDNEPTAINFPQGRLERVPCGLECFKAYSWVLSINSRLVRIF